MEEVKAAQTISQRGVMLIATVHGSTLPELIKDSERSRLVGGCLTVTLSGREADRRSDKRKQVLKRAREPVFSAALELHSRKQWVYHPNILQAVDDYLEQQPSEGAILLEAGQASQVAAIPLEGMFEYCTQCRITSNGFCAKHAPKQQQQNQSRQSKNRNGCNNGKSSFSYTVGGDGGGKQNGRRR